MDTANRENEFGHNVRTAPGWCGDEAKIEPLWIEAAAAPDTVLAGEPIEVKVHWHQFLAQILPTGFIALDDTTFELLVRVRIPSGGDDIAAPSIPQQTAFLFEDPPKGFFRIRLKGANTIDLPVQPVDSLPQVEQLRFHVQREPSAIGVEGVIVSLLDPDVFDTLLVAQTSNDGVATGTLPCMAGGRPYLVLSDGHFSVEAVAYPARCGVPERLVIRW